ncbi:putative Holliday junction resolvase-like endonuclease [Breznakia pachnodae]|uniref:Holliday junction resolvase-like endonuclease n=1 Tax=Breznakia pachnodae TaxID=265178 RepID=A0ABU0E6M1_9FIRM|nr:putative Holliday junction resolvase-like endonuclease [Breznakia pachnodae]
MSMRIYIFEMSCKLMLLGTIVFLLIGIIILTSNILEHLQWKILLIDCKDRCIKHKIWILRLFSAGIIVLAVICILCLIAIVIILIVLLIYLIEMISKIPELHQELVGATSVTKEILCIN